MVQIPAFVHVTPAPPADDALPQEPAPVKTPPLVRFDAKVEGSLAVLPTLRLSTYYLMVGQSHQAAYEQSIFESLAADGRLKPVERAQLAKAMQERELQLAESPQAANAPMIAADVLVFSWIASRGGQGLLHVQAVHAPTTALLGEIELPIDAGHPLQFTPPLGEMLARWWPGVLRALVNARTRPVWTVVDVFAGQAECAKTAPGPRRGPVDADAGQAELAKAAAAIRRGLDEALAAEPTVFHAAPVPLGGTQQESLLWRMGLSQSMGGGFCRAADYLVDARLSAPGKLELRLRGSDSQVAARTVLSEPDQAKLVATAKAWLAARNRPTSGQAAARPKGRVVGGRRLGEATGAVGICRGLPIAGQDAGIARRPAVPTGDGDVALGPAGQAGGPRTAGRSAAAQPPAAQLDPTWETVVHCCSSRSSAIRPRWPLRTTVLRRKAASTTTSGFWRRFPTRRIAGRCSNGASTSASPWANPRRTPY